MTFLFGLTGYVYLFKEGGIFGPSSSANAGLGEPLQNSMVFAFGFFEIAMWFWVSTFRFIKVVWLSVDRSSPIFARNEMRWLASTMRSSKPKKIGYKLFRRHSERFEPFLIPAIA